MALTSVFSAPTYCSLNPSIAAWGLQTDGPDYQDYPLTTVSNIDDSDYTIITGTTTTTAARGISSFNVYPYSGYLGACEPSGALDTTYFSPGVCPESWTPAAFTISDAVTQALCCPTGVASSVSDGICSGFAATPVAMYTRDASATGVQNFEDGQTTTISAAIFYHYGPITVGWEQRDLSLFSPASAPLLMTQSSAFILAPTAPASASVTVTAMPTNEGRAGLSAGAQAGIGVGVTIIGLALVGAAVFAAFRMGMKRGETDVVTHDAQETRQSRTLQPEI
ncbi:hypothetical protein HII31_03327 [Pseudocercospora fuligena]|uniref:Uncharacterized protein n=1 Tax=Pseudocercospora fuligena TaxID=685502 RepID=A0A8H6RP68_9PEZI|nr:hypothetical protein HII31_03327 [Pseudocercospora fuligena]